MDDAVELYFEDVLEWVKQYCKERDTDALEIFEQSFAQCIYGLTAEVYRDPWFLPCLRLWLRSTYFLNIARRAEKIIEGQSLAPGNN
jgi:hypothetical protein